MASPLPVPQPVRVLFVCSGNICRSPLAEAVFRKLAAEAGLAERFEIDSAGMHGFHEGEPADPRTRRVAKRHGYDVTSISRPVRGDDLERFDLIVAMDRSHKRELLARGGKACAGKIRLLREFDPGGDPDVPDPYYGGERGFEDVQAIVEAGCRGLLNHLGA
ncbi:MAG: low molecular weight phosphotyrosine protein phosphatase [Vicinamibacteria bacterium]|nr:low molecular weight phosphotyrosine protein phosphatase [Vicinamibacteria bacterium]